MGFLLIQSEYYLDAPLLYIGIWNIYTLFKIPSIPN